MIQNSLHK